MLSNKPVSKVATGGLSGLLASFILQLLETLVGVDFPSDYDVIIIGVIVTIISTLSGWIKSPAPSDVAVVKKE